jgi:modification methylase eco47II
LEAIKSVIDDIGYKLITEPNVLKAMFYQVPQKRERLFFVGVRQDIMEKISLNDFKWPSPYKRIMTLRDAFKKGELYNTDVPKSQRQQYPKRKKEILDLVPAGGYWKDLPDILQKEYMQKSYFLGGGKIGMARRLSYDEPSLTLTCSPAQKQTERCHPEETRPLTVREYARIQTFPDDWEFIGSMTNQYKQIGNAVPVNLSYAVARSLVRLLNIIEKSKKVNIALPDMRIYLFISLTIKFLSTWFLLIPFSLASLVKNSISSSDRYAVIWRVGGFSDFGRPSLLYLAKVASSSEILSSFTV